LHSIAGNSLRDPSSRNRARSVTRRIDGVDQNTGPHSSAYHAMVARTSAEAMPALSAHWDLSKRHASLMAIFYVVMCNRGTRLRGWPDHRFVLLNLQRCRAARRCFSTDPSKEVALTLYAGSYAKVFAKVGLMGTPKRLWHSAQSENQVL
jgi:hypothetical protein